jgi:hypothetical protein
MLMVTPIVGISIVFGEREELGRIDLAARGI